MFFLPTDFVIFSTKKFGNFLEFFFGVACVNLNNLAIFFLQKFTKKLEKSKHGVGVVDITLWKFYFKPVL